LRRMALTSLEEPVQYLKLLRENRIELDVLYQDLLIPVTTFFRDPKSFENLCSTIFPQILKNKHAGETLRVWVAGCSTGQEAYSIAICLKEFLNDNRQRVQVFATDISEAAIAKARIGIYTKDELASVSSTRLQEFFTKINGSFHVNKSLREMCVFALHNFVKDPPFGKIDLVCCRNVLIYMEPYLQKKALTTFHYSLNPKGYLFLGKSETTSGVPDLFLTVGKGEKTFSRKDGPGKFMHVATERNEQNLSETDANHKKEASRMDFQKAADDIMLSKYTPAGVVVNEAMDIVHFRGNTGSYLEQASGKPSHNLFKMAKLGLAFELRNLLHKSKKQNGPVTKQNIPLQENGVMRNISIEALPLPNIIEPHFLILFHEMASSSSPDVTAVGGSKAKKGGTLKAERSASELRIRQLEMELAQTREDMRSITEDQEAANEELQSANEELLSGSEELQSLNEELETNKEELQSTNEELTVVNQEIVNLNEQITEARDYAESINTTIHEPIVILDRNLHIKSANKAFYKSFGVKVKDTEGTSLFELGDQQWNIPALRDLLAEIIPKNSFFDNFELKHHFEGIGEKTLMLNARMLQQKLPHEQLILLAIHDRTEVTSLALEVREKEKKLLKEQLESEKRDKKNAELKTKIAEDAVKAKQQFLSNMSHEIRTPMNAIIGFTNVVLKTQLDETQKGYINAIKISGDALIVLINDILDLAKVDAGKMTFEKTPFDLANSISTMLQLFEPKIKEKNLEMVLEYDERIPKLILGDPMRLRQIILNLMSNAVKFTTFGKISLRVAMLDQDEESTNVRFSLEDTGIGILADKLTQVFNTFEQAHDEIASSFGGTGLGLAIVKQLVELQDGEIGVKSEVGKGSTFSFTLRFGKAHLAPEIEADSLFEPYSLEHLSAFAGRKVKVLVVEDVALNQLLIKIIIAEFGFDLDIAGNGKIALEKVQTQNYDIILMDLQMPEMNGFEATEYIRNTLQLKVPIIALTADVTMADIEKCYAVGMNDYVSKPIDEKLLYRKLLECLKGAE
jgi:two-component system, chemotaxis family, CheB/CheR fusion protein